MSLSVKHLNADTTFLLTFAPAIAPDHARDRFPGSFTVLLDPWLAGSSSVWNPRFQISHHTTTPAVASLRDIPLPDLIIISQDKPDHCHKETLCTLDPNTRVNILATPAAAKRIRSWRHFQCADIQIMTPYNFKKSSTVHRIRLEPYTSNSAPGQVTISYMPEKRDMTMLHNAIGITYRAPGTTITSSTGAQIQLPLSPPVSPIRTRSTDIIPPRTSYSSDGTTPSEKQGAFFPSRPDTPMADHPATISRHTRPLTPATSGMDLHTSSKNGRTLSVLYSPHGVSLHALMPYITTHLLRLQALPLTLLFHSLNLEQNPWFMGGRVAAGLPGGLDIAKVTNARYWISAHDEVKDNRGWSICMLKSRAFGIEEAQAVLDAEVGREVGAIAGELGWTKGMCEVVRRTTVVDLGVGHEMKVC